MSTGKKILVLGYGDYLLAFKAMGCEVIIVGEDSSASLSEEEVSSYLNLLLNEDKYSIVFITETLAEKHEDFLKKADSRPYPSVVLIPDYGGSKGLANKRIKETVKKALGTDIF